MAKVAVALRLDPEVLAWVDAYARERGVSRQSVMEAAVLSLRDDATRGVPDLAETSPLGPSPVLDAVSPAPGSQVGKASRPMRPLPPGVKTASELAMDRMRRMNPERYGGGS